MWGNTLKRDRGYYASHFTTSELRRMLREAEDRRTHSDSDTQSTGHPITVSVSASGILLIYLLESLAGGYL